MRVILVKCSELNFAINHVRLGSADPIAEETQDIADQDGIGFQRQPRKGLVTVDLKVKGKRPITQLITGRTGHAGEVRARYRPSIKHRWTASCRPRARSGERDSGARRSIQ